MDLTRSCPSCGGEKQYSNKYDAYYCELCNKWLEDRCADTECELCISRPNKPSQILS